MSIANCPIDPVEKNDSDRRRWHRYALHRPTWVNLNVGGKSARALVRDVSLGGICLDMVEGVPAVGALRVAYGGAPVFLGQPVWRTSGALGLQFLGQPTEIDHVLLCVNMLLGLDSGNGKSANRALGQVG